MKYTSEEHATWSFLIKRQREFLKNYACSEYLKALQNLNLDEANIPEINGVEKTIRKYIGWNLEVVHDIVPTMDYFTNYLVTVHL